MPAVVGAGSDRRPSNRALFSPSFGDTFHFEGRQPFRPRIACPRFFPSRAGSRMFGSLAAPGFGRAISRARRPGSGRGTPWEGHGANPADTFDSVLVSLHEAAPVPAPPPYPAPETFNLQDLRACGAVLQSAGMVRLAPCAGIRRRRNHAEIDIASCLAAVAVLVLALAGRRRPRARASIGFRYVSASACQAATPQINGRPLTSAITESG